MHLKEFESVTKVVQNLETKVEQVNQVIVKLEKESITSIATSVHKLEQTVTKDLIAEINESRTKKNEMVAAKNDMQIAWQDLHETFLSK